VVGRGSGASSIVAYVLGITNVDPLRHELCFERFLHDRRADLPDLDVDLCWRGRDEVIGHVYATHGRDRAAMISTHGVMRPRSAFREVAKARGVPAAEVDRMSKTLPWYDDRPLAETIRSERAASRAIPLDEEPFRTIVAEAEGLRGFPRGLGIHCGGVVIADRPLDRYVPLEWAAKGIVVTQFEMRAIERVGLVKFDLLGNRALTTLRETVRRAKADRGEDADLDATAEDDPGAAALLSSGRTLGCFQVESPAMRQMLVQLKVRDLEGTIDALSLVRPGPAGSGMKDAYVRRAAGLEPDPALPEAVAAVIGKRHGVLLYEEDVMACAAALTGGTLADGDLLRRAIAKGKQDKNLLRKEFLRKAIGSGADPDVAAEVWAQMEKFSSYAFCRAHAAGYGVLAHRSAAMKARFPAQYACAVMNNHAGMYPSRVHFEEAKRTGVRTLPPCVNRSGDAFETEGPDAIRVGLGRVRSLTERTREALIAERARRPFESLGDFLRRVRAAYRETEALVRAGAFGFTGLTRPELLYRLRAASGGERKGSKPEGETFFRGDLCPAEDLRLPEYDPWKVLELEEETLGLFVSGHPMALLKPKLGGKTVAAAELGSRAGKRAAVAGVLSAHRRAWTAKKKEEMEFATLEDETGLAECTLFPAAFQRFGGRFRSIGPYFAEGRVEDRAGSATLTVSRIVRIDREGRERQSDEAGNG
jgi:DNA-directed DNA polymerase III PolC